MRRTRLALVPFLLAAPLFAADADPTRVLGPNEKPADARLGKPKDLNGYFPFNPPSSRSAWNDRARQVREQVLVANGLWPMPDRPPVKAVIHGAIARDGYTVEKVYFASYPGHYVTGNLYRPTGKAEGKRPAVLSPHGHWANGRFFEAPEAQAKAQIKSGAEQTMEGARYPLQARCAQLARMGFVVFHYDMVGYADSQTIPHRVGFTDPEAELRLQSFMGLQTFNTIRALDFLSSLPDVDPKRIGVTGASGGGTQTFILGAIDDRPAAEFPAVMVSTAMQGGCVCENCSYLRVGTGNVEFAGLFAPKPLAMSAANDWTVEIETKGLPQLKQLYGLFDAQDKVAAKCWKEFGHNYNQRSREMMYSWFNKYLLGGSGEVKEKPFVPVPPKELSVFNSDHPRPKDELDAAALRKVMTKLSDDRLKELAPKDAASLAEFRRVVGTALRVMVADSLPKPADVEAKEVGDRQERDGLIGRRYLLGRKGANEQVPAIGLCGKDFDGTVVVWVHPRGKASLFEKGQLVPEAKAIIAKKAGILAIDAFQTGEVLSGKPFPVNPQYAGYTFGYNRPVLAQRVHDILTAIAFVKGHEKTKTVHLVGWEAAGPWVVLARALCGDAVARTAADANQFRFENVKTTNDEMMLPGAVKYGGLPAFLALCAPGEVFFHNHKGTSSGGLSKAAYDAAGAQNKLRRSAERADPSEVVGWLLGG